VAPVNSDAQSWIRAYQISRTQNFRSEGRRRLRPRSRSGPCPLPLSHAKVFMAGRRTQRGVGEIFLSCLSAQAKIAAWPKIRIQQR